MSNTRNKNSIRYKWSSTQTEELVKLYIQHECLWNPGHLNYRKRSIREEACASIINDFREITDINLSHNDLRLRLKTIRTMYLQQLKLILNRSTPDNIFRPTIPWFDLMDRNLKHIAGGSVKNKFSNELSSSDTSNMDHFDDKEDNDIPLNEYVAMAEESNELDPFTKDSNSTIQQQQPHSTKTKEKHQSKRKKLNQNMHVNSSSEILHYEQPNRVEDEFDIYGRHIATQLRHMKLEKALRIQLQIQTLITEARIDDTSDIKLE